MWPAGLRRHPATDPNPPTAKPNRAPEVVTLHNLLSLGNRAAEQKYQVSHAQRIERRGLRLSRPESVATERGSRWPLWHTLKL